METSTAPWAPCAGALQLFREEMFPDVQPDPLLVQCGTITSSNQHHCHLQPFSKRSMHPQQVLRSRFGHAAPFAEG